MNNLDLLKVYRFDKKVHLGQNSDGGYVFGEVDGGYDCYISCGVSYEESFTRDFINKYNMNKSNSFAFDGTIPDYPYFYTPNITFTKINIGDGSNNTYNLLHVLEHFKNIFLKMDIEGGEYPWLLSIDEKLLSNVKQLVIEMHGITNDTYDCKYADKMKCLEKLSKTHYLVHAHGNNHAEVVNGIPHVIELSYINKSYFTSPPELNTQPLPIKNLDFPNKLNSDDIDLNFYPFCNNGIVKSV